MPKSPFSNAASYPSTLYPPADFPNLSDAEERRRLSQAAMRGFFNIMKHWGVRDEDARVLLGGIGNGTYYQWKQGSAKLLEQDRLVRISYLIGIFKSLNLLFSPRLADKWVHLANTNEIFSGRAPLEYMLRGGPQAMDMVRRLLDARRGG